MTPGNVTFSHPSGESGDTERIKDKELEEGEIEDDDSADEDLQLSRPLPPSSDLIKTSKRKRSRKAASKKINNVLKKRKLNHASSFEGTMKTSLDDGTIQTNGNELFSQSKHPIIRNNDTPFTNRDEYLSRVCSDFHNDITCSSNYNIYDTFYLGIKSAKCKKKKLRSKKKRLENSFSKNYSLPSELEIKLCKSYPENKNDKCSYMHSQFPCKFSNTEVRCTTGDHCKFGLEVFAESLTDPKKIYSNSSLLAGDGEAEVLNTRKRHNKNTKKIPSLLEIVVPIPQQFLANGSNITARAEQSTPSKYHTTSLKETRPCTLMPSSLKKDKFPIIQQRDINSFAASSDPNYDRMRQSVGGKKEELSNGKKQPTIFNKQDDIGGCVYDCISAESSLSSMSCTKKSQTETTHHREIIVPHNLPKKQQELFLRIQQRQRKPLYRKNRDLGEQDKTRNEEDKKETVDEQNLYSSDEDDSSLVSVLKNLPKLQSFPTKASISSISTPLFCMTQSGDKFLSNIRESSSENAANLTAKSVPSPKICEHFYSMMQTQSKEPRCTLQNTYHSSKSAAISSVDISEHRTPTPVPTKSSSNGTATYFSSLGNISAYKAAIESCAGGRILDFRNMHNVQQISLQSKIKRDVDLRQNSISLTSLFSTFNGNKIHRDAIPSKDVDLKGIAGLPFGAPSLHPTTEINASLNGHAPIPYKLIPITVPPSDNSGLRVYAQASRDPRLHRPSSIFNGINMKVILECLSKIKNL